MSIFVSKINFNTSNPEHYRTLADTSTSEYHGYNQVQMDFNKAYCHHTHPRFGSAVEICMLHLHGMSNATSAITLKTQEQDL